jgi:hypothetical protein
MSEIVNLDEFEKKERKRELNRQYYHNNAGRIIRRTRIRRKKEPVARFKYVDGKLYEFYTTNDLAWYMRVKPTEVRLLISIGVIKDTPFNDKGRGNTKRTRLYTKEMRDIIVTSYVVAKEVCGSRGYRSSMKKLLHKKWIQAEINGVW